MRVISAMLHSDTACISILDTLTENDFSDPFNRDLFLLANALFTQGVKPTHAEMIKEGMKLGFVKNIEDADRIRYVSEQYIDDENTGYWASKVKQAAKGRAMQSLLKRYSHELSKGTADIPDLIQTASSEMFSLAMGVEDENFVTGKELGEYGLKLIDERVDRYRKAMEDTKHPGEIPLEGVATGLPTLDKLTLGYKPGDLIMLSAQTGHGKTAFALNTANAVCIKDDKPLLYINTEMSKDQIVTRWGSMLSDQLIQQIRIGSLTNNQVSEIKKSYQKLINANFITIKLASPTASKVDIITRKAKMQCKIEMMILDYIGRMQKHQKGREEWQVLEQIMQLNKELAMNQGIAVMVLAQLNDDLSIQGAKRQRNECDISLKLIPIEDDKRRKYIEERLKKQYEKDFNYALYVDKARDFETGRYIPLVFDKQRQQIREAQEMGKFEPVEYQSKNEPKKNSRKKNDIFSAWENLGNLVDEKDLETR